MNKYLTVKRDEYESLRKSIEGFQTRAADETRDLTDTELSTVTEQGEQARRLADEITALVEIEQRNAKVAALAADVDTATRTATTTAVDRDPGHYRSESEGGTRSFFADLMRSREDDGEAKTRLTEHMRALTSSSAGTGILPPKWLTDEYINIARQTRRVANAVRHIPLGNDPRPITLPKQTAATSVATQAGESTVTSFTDAFTTGVDTVTPVTLVGGQKVSRQLLDSSTPAIDQLIYGDLMTDYNTKVEARVVAAMVTAAGTADTAYATEAAYTTATATTSSGTPLLKDIRKSITNVRNARKLPPDLLVASVPRYGTWLDITDTQGRPLIPVAQYGTMNVFGQGDAMNDGQILGLNIVASDGLTYQTYPESILVARSQDTILFESNMLRFRYEEPDGPETIRLGVWGYVGVITRYPAQSVRRLQVTLA